MLHSLSVKGFKKHLDRNLILEPGLNYIVGPNYSGKSSLLHAILFAMGGVQAVSGGAEVAFNWGTSSTLVAATWSDYVIKRTRTSGGTELLQNGDPIASGITAMNTRLTQVFGMPAKDLLKVIYAEQGSTAALVSDMGEAEVNRLIETISGVDEAKAYLKAISSMRSEIKGSLEALAPSGPSRTELEAAVAKQKAAKNISAAGLAQAKEVRKSYEVQADQLDKDYSTAVQAEQAQATVTSAQERVLEIQTKQTALQKVDEVTEVEVADATRATAEAEADLTKIQGQFRAAVIHESKQSAAEAQVARLEDKCWSADKLRQADEDILAAEEGEQATSSELSALAGKILQGQVEVTAKRAMLEESACPTCGRAYSEGTINPTEVQDDIDELLSGIAAYQALERKTQEGLDTHTSFLRTARADKQQALRDLQALEEAKETLETLQVVSRGTVTETNVQDAISAVSARKEQQHAITDRYHAWLRYVEQKIKLAEQLSTMQLVLEELQEKVKAFGFTDSSEKLLSERQKVIKLYRVASDNVTGLTRELADIDSVLARLQRDLKSEQAREQKYAGLSNRDAGLARLRKFLSEHRASFLEGVWNKVLAHVSEVMNIATGGAMLELTRTDGSFRYREEGSEKFRPLAAASGSQKAVVGIGLKVALSKSLPHSAGFLLLDEATSDMDAIHSAAVMKYLSNCGLQVIAVTHNQEDLAVSANVIQLQ